MLAGPDAVPTGLGTGITAHDTSMVTISGSSRILRPARSPAVSPPQAAGTYRDD
jgi:hypothetical protein